MIQSAFLADNHGSRSSKSATKQTLLDAIEAQINSEKASFHTPGHKGRLSLRLQTPVWSADLTELPGLDELAESAGILEKLQNRICEKWNARRSFISVNGASAALCAAIIACAGLGTKIVLPRNVHRSALNALLITGLDPIWYEAEWLDEWQCWGAASEESLNNAIGNDTNSIAAIVVCSPSYSGSISNIKALSTYCHERAIQLIVDEAHGAHLLSQNGFHPGALAFDADLVVHSLHKTLSAPTQTGV
ncbi:MAG: aminotransferase class I/II-fold pyridoxal phosphate-dependent enzyme, partial [Candidatus Obscuribacterales bacterium]|nr:aminotransferase class I/II-fold pyridoxal phosphate-dependent enzyme [Candidatus Obscuribacterales bacterium]